MSICSEKEHLQASPYREHFAEKEPNWGPQFLKGPLKTSKITYWAPLAPLIFPTPVFLGEGTMFILGEGANPLEVERHTSQMLQHLDRFFKIQFLCITLRTWRHAMLK